MRGCPLTDRRFSFPSSLFSLVFIFFLIPRALIFFPLSLFSPFSCFYLLFHSMSVKFYPLPFSVTLWCADIALQSVKPPKKKKKHCTDEAQKAETVLSAVSYIYIYIYIFARERIAFQQRNSLLQTRRVSASAFVRGLCSTFNYI